MTKDTQPGKKTGIRYKVTLTMCLTTTIVMLTAVGLGYFFGMKTLRGMAGDVHRKMSQLLAGHLTRVFEEEAGRIKIYSEDPLWKTNYTKDAGNAALKALAEGDANVAGLAVFDLSGALLADSGSASPFSFGEYGWKEKFFSDKAGRTLIGDIEFDEALNKWVIPVWMPVRAADGSSTGIFRAELSAGKLFSSLNAFRVDRTGHAVLIDGAGNIMFHPGDVPTNVKLCGDDDYKRLFTSRGKYAIIYDTNIHKRRIFTAFSEVMSPALIENNKTWRVLIEQDVEEVYAPLNRVVGWMLVAVAFLLVFMVVVSFIFSGVLVRPIQSLYLAAVQIMRGNWNYNINIRTGDEIEQFADAFRAMVSTIKGEQEDLVRAKNELEELSKTLEKKVQARTIDLTMAKDKLDSYSKELEKALVVKSDFVSMASHELRTPLTAIKEGISIVLQEKAGPVTAQEREFLEMAKRNVDRLGRLINDILDFQKIEQGKLLLKVETNDINETAKEAAGMMEPLAKEKGLELAMELASGLPKIRFDKDRVTQVLTNLIGNAIKFTEAGKVTVRTLKDDSMVKVEVHDTGVGIRPRDMSRLFQKFSQIEKGLERKGGGSGLGLIISKEIIEKHGGKIGLESEPGRGTLFYFLLPVKN